MIFLLKCLSAERREGGREGQSRVSVEIIGRWRGGPRTGVVDVGDVAVLLVGALARGLAIEPGAEKEDVSAIGNNHSTEEVQRRTAR